MPIDDFIRGRKYLRKLMPGIRFKFALLIGILISLVLATATYINNVNQSNILRTNFDDETESSLNYINPIINSIDSIRSNLLLVEDLKIRVNEKSEDLKKYKTYTLKRKDTVTNSFRNIGKKLGFKVSYDYYFKGNESYYSRYLSKKDISTLEKKTASQLRQGDGSPVSSREFAEIQKKANKVMEIRNRIGQIQNQIDANNERISTLAVKAELSDNGKDRLESMKNEIRKLEAKLAGEKKRISDAGKIFRNMLNPYYNFQLKRIDEAGSYNKNIRIITYNNAGDVDSDTGGYFRETLISFSPLFKNENFEKDRSAFFKNIDVFSSIKPREYDYNTGEKYFNVRYVPVYKNPATSERLMAIYRELGTGKKNWARFLEEDTRICGELSEVTRRIRNRLELLRARKTVPGKDGQFTELYSSYRKLIAQRDDALRQYAPYQEGMNLVSAYYNSKIKELSGYLAAEEKKIADLKSKKEKNADEYNDDIESYEAATADLKNEIKKIKADMEESKEDISKHDGLIVLNAMLYLRDAAIYDYAILKQKRDPSGYRNYLRSLKTRDIEHKRWKTLREWIMTAKSETNIPESVSGMKNVKLAVDGVLAYSRSEAEEYMWRVDSTPFAGKPEFSAESLAGGLVEDLLAQNITGFHGVFIDKTGGVENIARNRDRMIVYSVITALIAIVLTYFLSGFMVRRIKGIIAKVKLAGRGNLNVRFDEQGLDEVEDLAVSLNRMICSLKEKEELKGEIAAAGEIQKTLLPEKIPSNLEGYYTIGTFYRPMRGVGGDYYDFIELDSESIFFCIADVSSHGVGPAIVMSMLRTHIHGILRRGVRDLKEILLELNRQIFIETPPQIFVTIFTGIINRKINELEYCSAGHPRAILYKYQKEEVEVLDGGGLPVGMDDTDIFPESLTVKKIKMRPGDLFFQYTDGLSEAMNGARNLFGENRICDEIKKYSRKKSDYMIKKIAEAVEAFTGKVIIESSMSELNDDIAMIALKRIR